MISVGTTLGTQTNVNILCAPAPFAYKKELQYIFNDSIWYSAFSPTHHVYLQHWTHWKLKQMGDISKTRYCNVILRQTNVFWFQNSSVIRVCYWGSDYLTISHALFRWWVGPKPVVTPIERHAWSGPTASRGKQQSLSLRIHHPRIVRCWKVYSNLFISNNWLEYRPATIVL